MIEAVNAPKVMIVDDEVDLAYLFALMLSSAGYETIVEYDVEEAIRALGDLRPDLIVLDVMMPGASGLDLCRYVRRKPGLAQVPIIIVSALDRAEDVRVGLEAGANQYFAKPIQFGRLEEAVEKALHP